MSAESCAVVTTVVARGSLATVGTFAHGGAWGGDPDEEAFTRPAAVFTTAGRWRFHGRHGPVDVDEGVVVFGHAGESYRCSHEGTPNDRTLDVSVLGDYELPPRGSVSRIGPLDVIVQALTCATEALRVDALALTLLCALHDVPADTPRIDAAKRRTVELSKEYLMSALDSDVTLEQLARQVHVSPFHLQRVFRSVEGVSPHEYLTRLRMRRAVELLDDGWTVAETAAAVGFRSTAHFSRQFRRRVGVVPSRYGIRDGAAARPPGPQGLRRAP